MPDVSFKKLSNVVYGKQVQSTYMNGEPNLLTSKEEYSFVVGVR